ncbi:MAG: glycosyltransferase [Candidatus Saccharibacteria bacterium]
MSNTMPTKSPLRVNLVSESVFTVQGHGVHTAFAEMLAAMQHNPDIDVAVNKFRKADITHIHTVGLYSLLHLIFGSGKKVVSVHVIPDSFIGSLVGAKYWRGAARLYLRFFYGRAGLLLAVSPQVLTDLKGELGLKNPMVVHYNGIEPEKFVPPAGQKAVMRKKLGLPADSFTIVSVGQVQPRKRFDIFVDLARKYPDRQFVWVGGIPFKHLGADYVVMTDLMEHAPNNVVVTGVITAPEVIDYYWASDAFALFSNQENHPMAVLEAAAAELPVILRDIPEYVPSFGGDALFGTDDTFGALIESLDDKKVRAKALEGSKRISAHYNARNLLLILIERYQSLIAGSK